MSNKEKRGRKERMVIMVKAYIPYQVFDNSKPSERDSFMKKFDIIQADDIHQQFVMIRFSKGNNV